MSEHPNATLVRNVMDAVMRGDVDAVVNAYTEDGIYRVGGDNLVSGVFQGRQAIRDFFFHLVAVTEGTMRLSVEDVIGTDNYAVMFWTLAAQRQGKSIDAKGAMAFKINADNKFTESWFLYNDQRAYDEFYR